ncbi:MAG: 30S ribosomal protein S7 [Gammaproteobacteria bacterium]
MSRKKFKIKHKRLPDPKYGSQLVAKFINHVMLNGKKAIAEKIVYGAFDLIGERRKTDGLNIFEQVMDKLRPNIEVKSRRVGGATYQVPVEVRPDRAQALAMRWLIAAAKQRNEKGMIKSLASEMLDILDGRGGSMKKREDVERMAMANQAFAHYRW